jgi:hypothetical protein
MSDKLKTLGFDSQHGWDLVGEGYGFVVNL